MIKFYFKIGGKNVASAHFKDENWVTSGDKTFILERNSILKDLVPRIQANYKAAATTRDNLILNKKIKNNILLDDIECSSPSLAGTFVCGKESNGLTDFKDKNGNTIKDYYENKVKAKDPIIFSDEKIENVQIKIVTKNTPREDRIEDAYKALGYEELLLSADTAINLNHTSLFVAEKLCNAIPEKFWVDKDIWKRKILNPFGDSGFLEKYIITKLMNNYYMKKKFPDYGMRAYWILHNMMFSIAKTNATSYWLRKIVYYSADATIRGGDNYPAMFHGRLFTQGADKDKLETYHRFGNVKTPLVSDCGEDNIFDYPMLDWIKSKKPFIEYVARVFWDVFTNEKYDEISEERRTEIMEEIKEKLDGYFDIVIGNPPYNTNNEETGAVAETVYNYFCMAADELHPKYESFIIPSKWAYGKARISQDFPQSVLNDEHVNYFELLDGDDAFPTVDTGEISIYSKDNTKLCDNFKFNNYGKIHDYKNIKDITYEIKGKRWLKPIDSIIDKIQAKITKSLADDTKMFSLKSGVIYDIYGDDALSNSAIGFRADSGKLVKLPDGTIGKRISLDYSLEKTKNYYDTKFYITRTKLWKNNEYPIYENDKFMPHIYINKSIIKDYCGMNNRTHKLVVMPPRWNYHQRLLDYPYNAYLIEKDSYTTFQYIVGASTRTDKESENILKFLKTKFATYMCCLNAISQNFSPESLRFVPYMDFTQEWTDEKLNKFFELDEEEIKRINDLWAEFRPMRRAQMQELDEENEKAIEEEEEV